MVAGELAALTAFNVGDTLMGQEEVGVDVFSHGEHTGVEGTYLGLDVFTHQVHLGTEVADILPLRRMPMRQVTVDVSAASAAIAIAVAVFTELVPPLQLT